MQKPSKGRIVHYRDKRGRTYAAIIVEVDAPNGTGLVNLAAFRPWTHPKEHPVVTVTAVPYSDQPQNEHWSWPPRI